jgi:hypothetical protein
MVTRFGTSKMSIAGGADPKIRAGNDHVERFEKMTVRRRESD